MAQYGYGRREEGSKQLHDASARSDTRFSDSGREGLHDREKKIGQEEEYNVYNGEPENATYTTDEALEERYNDAPLKEKRGLSEDAGLTEGGFKSIAEPQQYGNTPKVAPDAGLNALAEQYGHRESGGDLVGTDARYNLASDVGGTGYTDSGYAEISDKIAALNEPKTYEAADSEGKLAGEGIVPNNDAGMGVNAMNDDVQEPACTQYGGENDYKEQELRREGYDERKLEEQKVSDELKHANTPITPVADGYNEKERQPEKHEGVMEKIKETLLPCYNTPTQDDEDEDVRKLSAQEADPAAKSHIGFVDKVKEKLTGKPAQAEPADKETNVLHVDQHPSDEAHEAPKKGLLGKIKDKLYPSP